MLHEHFHYNVLSLHRVVFDTSVIKINWT